MGPLAVQRLKGPDTFFANAVAAGTVLSNARLGATPYHPDRDAEGPPGPLQGLQAGALDHKRRE